MHVHNVHNNKTPGSKNIDFSVKSMDNAPPPQTSWGGVRGQDPREFRGSGVEKREGSFM